MNKKHKIAIAVAISLVVLIGVIVGIILANSNKDKSKKNPDYTVHESDKNTIEEESENGMTESDSEDGPVLDENAMIDFNGGDKEDTSKEPTDEGKDQQVNPDKPTNPDEPEEPDVPDTGTWGGFY